MKVNFNKILKSGDSVLDILYYWLPETISNAMLISLPPIIDAWIISNLHSTTTYGAQGMVNNFLHLLIKLAEAIPVASIAIIGRHNGAKEYEKCGKDLGSTFWTTTLIGLIFFSVLFFGAPAILGFMGLPAKMTLRATPFLKIRSFGILLTFISLAFFAFMRSVKNTKTPMFIYMIGNAIFLILDYMLVLGKGGFKSYGLKGSGYAIIIQYLVMIAIAFTYIIKNDDYKKYFPKMFFNYFSIEKFKKIMYLSLPIMVDKGSLATAYVILGKIIATLGKYPIASYSAIKDLERFAFLPAVGFSQIIVFLVSNQLGAKNPTGAKNNIKKVMVLAGGMLVITLSILTIYSKELIQIFDAKNKFTNFAAPALVFINIFVLFDLVQLILAGALRGAGDVKTVMKVRFFSVFFFFFPLATYISKIQINNTLTKFIAIHVVFYLNAALMGILLLRRFKTNKWQNKKL